MACCPRPGPPDLFVSPSWGFHAHTLNKFPWEWANLVACRDPTSFLSEDVTLNLGLSQNGAYPIDCRFIEKIMINHDIPRLFSQHVQTKLDMKPLQTPHILTRTMVHHFHVRVGFEHECPFPTG